jgi:hypothetical protein
MATYTLTDTGLQPVEVQMLKSLQQRNNEVTYSAAHNNGITVDNVATRDAKMYGNINAGVR